MAGCDKEADPLRLDRTHVDATLLNATYTVPVKGGSGRYAASTNTPQIADVRIETMQGEKVLIIGTKQEGTASILVTDTDGGVEICSLIVKADANSGYGIVEARYAADAVDANVKRAIEAELRDNPPFPIGSVFEIISPSNDPSNSSIGEWIVRGADGMEITRGVFTAEKHGNFPSIYYPSFYSMLPIEYQIYTYIRFTVDLDGKKSVYDMYRIRGSATKASPPPTPRDFLFYEDLTDYYQTKYPDAGVKGVVRALICEYRFVPTNLTDE